MKFNLPALGLASLLAAGIAAPALAQPAFPTPPPEVGEPPPPPGPPERFVIEPGHWQWAGGRYVWERRHWIPVRRGYVHFVPGHWGRNYRGPRWIPAHWNR
jgi:hypothetical protein